MTGSDVTKIFNAVKGKEVKGIRIKNRQKFAELLGYQYSQSISRLEAYRDKAIPDSAEWRIKAMGLEQYL